MNIGKNLIALSVMFSFLPLAAPVQAQRAKRTDPNTYYRAPHSMAGKMIVLPIGTTFEGRINKTISSSKSHAGEAFSIILSAPVLANGIEVVIPVGSEVIGEVVEAISSSSQPHKRKMPKPKGKLRVQINQLRTPDGTSFPLVGNLVGEQATKGSAGRHGLQTPLGSNVGYVGTSEAFEAIAPGANRYGKQITPGRGPDYVKKREFLAHEIYGSGGDQYSNFDDRRIRSLVLRKMDLWIDAGSPLTVKLQAPMRLSVTPHSIGSPVGDQDLGTAIDEPLPGPSASGAAASDIPPITESGAGAGQLALPPLKRRDASQTDAAPAPPQATPPPAPAQPAPANPGASPSSEF